MDNDERKNKLTHAEIEEWAKRDIKAEIEERTNYAEKMRKELEQLVIDDEQQ